MCDPMSAAAGGQLGAGLLGAYSQNEQGKMNQSYYNYLAGQTEKQKAEVDKAAEEQLSVISADSGRQMADVTKNTKQTVSSQKAAMAANGVYSDSGTFSDILNDTTDKEQLDLAAVKYNADQAMWQTKRSAINQKLDLSAQGTSLRVQGSNARAAGKLNAISTLVGSAANAGASYAGAKK